MSDSNPVFEKAVGKAAKNTGYRLFVHECRCMAALTKSAGIAIWVVKFADNGKWMRE